jgi:hypothetical protein
MKLSKLFQPTLHCLFLPMISNIQFADIWLYKDCVDDPVDGPSTTGNLLCLDLGGIPPGKRSMNVRDLSPLNNRDSQGRMTCDECLGLNGNEPAVTEEEVTICYLTIGDSDTYGNQTSCPGDKPPPTVSQESPTFFLTVLIRF